MTGTCRSSTAGSVRREKEYTEWRLVDVFSVRFQRKYFLKRECRAGKMNQIQFSRHQRPLQDSAVSMHAFVVALGGGPGGRKSSVL